MQFLFRESPEFTQQLQLLGDVPGIDEALRGLQWGILTDPEDFDIVPGFSTLRVAKTEVFRRPTGNIPRLRVFFSYPRHSEIIELLWIEYDSDGE